MNDIEYKVRARQISSCDKLPSLCRMEISVGQEYHEGKKLIAALNWAREKFDKQVILLGDLPQRYNYAFEHQIEINKAADIAIRKGNEWLERNGKHLYNFEIYRWDYFLSHPDYIETKKRVEHLFEHHKEFNKRLLGAIDDIWNRKDYADNRKQEFYSISQSYLLEETTVFAMAYKQFKGVSAYPGTFLELWGCFVNKEALQGLEGLSNAHCVRLNFTRKKAQGR